MVGVPSAGVADPYSAQGVASSAGVELPDAPQVAEVHPRDVALYRASRGTGPNPVVLVEVGASRREEDLEDGLDIVALVVIAAH